MNLTLNTKVKQNPRVTKKILKARVYIFDGKNLNLHSFNELASFLFIASKKPISIEQLTCEVIGKFKVSRKVAQKDIKEFINYCLENKFLTKVKK